MSDQRWIVGEGEAGERLDKYLAAAGRIGSRGKAAAALERGKVFVNGEEAALADASRRLAAGDEVHVWQDRPGSSRRRPATRPKGDLQVIHEDDRLLVVDKPPGLLSVPLERKSDQLSVYDLIVQRDRSKGKRRPFVVHRIDEDTSGLVLFAKDTESQRRLKGQFARHEPERVYLAVVLGHPDPAAGTWRDRLVWDDRAMIQRATHPRDPSGSDAAAEYRTIERFARAALIEVRLVTGRRNQIRLQARLRGHPLVGEERYTVPSLASPAISFGRQALHAFRLGIVHPSTGERLRLEAPIPSDFADLLTRLRRRANS